jgi:Family of unknown function (DUF6662)
MGTLSSGAASGRFGEGAALAAAFLLFVFCSGLGIVASAKADEQLFAFARSSETLPAGHAELMQFVTLRTGKDSGTYYGFDFDTEVEYGITDRIEGSLSIVNRYFDYHGVEELDDSNQFWFGGVELAGKFNVLSPFEYPVGLALRLEGGYLLRDEVGGLSEHERYLFPEVVLQTNFLDDTLIWDVNLGSEWAWGKQPAEQYPREMSLEGRTGVAWRFAPNWFVGGEVGVRSEYPLFTLDQFEHAVVYAGPSIHYSSQRWWVTASYLYQAWGEGVDELGNGQTFAEETSSVARIKIGFNF